MPTLAACIRKAGKALDAGDAAGIREIYADLLADDIPATEAVERAIDEYVSIMAEEEIELLGKLREAGGDVTDITRELRFAKGVSREQRSADRISVRDVLYGSATIPQLGPGKGSGANGKITVADMARVLTARTRRVFRGKTLAARNARNKEIIATVLADETQAAMQQSGHAGNWYKEVVERALRIVGELHPEVNTDPNARMAFLAALAITSNGAEVNENAENALQVYEQYKKSARSPGARRFPLFGVGPSSEAMENGFATMNKMIEQWGLDFTRQFMSTRFTNSELTQLGMKVNGENANAQLHGSAVLGPKIGGGFFQNLIGNFKVLTMDRWFMRTWGRIVGNLAPEGLSAAQDQVANFREEVRKTPQKVINLGYNVDEVLADDAKLVELATAMHAERKRGKHKDRSGFSNRAKTLDERVNSPVISPRNGAERAWIREVGQLVVDKLAARGIDTDLASMQALIWFPEKQLYLKYGAGNAKITPTDYEQEFATIARDRGVSAERIGSARSGSGLQRRPGPVGTAGEAAAEEINRGGLDPDAKSALLHRAAVRNIRQATATPYRDRVPRGPQKVLNGARVAQVHSLEVAQKNQLTKAGLAAPVFWELTPSSESAAAFVQFANKAKQGNDRAGEINILSAESYETLKVFVATGGEMGFALDDDQIVTMFKVPNAEGLDGGYQALFALAVQLGGRRMKIFDAFIPKIAAFQGFEATSREAFDPERAPADWDEAAFAQYNDGQPDLVYMVHNPDNFEDYRGEGNVMSESAAQGQQTRAASKFRLGYEPENIRFRLGDDVVEDMNDRNPENPLSINNKIGATMEDQARYNPGTVQSMKDSMRDWGAKQIQKFLAAIPRRNLPDFVRTMTALKDYVRAATKMDGRRNELLQKFGELGDKWAKFVRQNRALGAMLGQLMHASTLAEVDPSLPYAPIIPYANMTAEDRALDAKRRADHKLLKNFWNKLPKEAQDIFHEVRDTHSDHRVEILAALENRINASEASGNTKRLLIDELRKKFESSRMQGPYFPLARFGKYWAVAKDSNGDVVSFSKFESPSERRAWMKEFEDDGFITTPGEDLDPSSMAKIDPRFVGAIQEQVAKLGPGGDALADEIWQLYLRSMPEMSMRKAFIHRKGRLGFSANALRAYGHHMFHGAHQLAKLENMVPMEQALDAARKQSEAIAEDIDNPDNLWARPLFSEMQMRHDWAMAPQASTLATRLTALGFAWYLGMTPAAALVNLSQTVMVAFPTLAARFGNVSRAAFHISKAAGQWFSSTEPMSKKLKGNELKAFTQAYKDGLFEKTLAHDVSGIGEGMDPSSTMARTQKMIAWMFHKMEEANRQITFMAAYRLSIEAGREHTAAIIEAEDLTWDSHFDYTNANRPRIMQNDFAKVIMLFKQFSTNMTYRLARDLRDGYLRNPTIGEAEKREAKARLAGILVMTSVLGGITAMPLKWAVTMILDAMLGDEDDPFDSESAFRSYLSEITSPKAAEAIMKGPWDAFTGMTLSSRISLNNLWLRDPLRHLEGEDLWQHYLGEAAGPVLSIPKDYFDAYSKFKQGYADRGLERLMPKVSKDFLKAWRYLNEGALNYRQQPIMPAEAFNSWDLSVQVMGFTPAKLTVLYEENAAIQNEAGAIKRRRTLLMDRYFLGIRMQDVEETKQASADIDKFNLANPAVPIMTKQLLKSAKTRQKRDDDTIQGIVVGKGYEYLHNKYDFAPRFNREGDLPNR